MDVYEISRPATIMLKLRANSEEEAEALFNSISFDVGTLQIDTSDWRFKDCLDREQRDAIVDAYAEEI